MTSGSIVERYSIHLENAMKISIASTTLAFLSSFSITDESFASLSPSPAMRVASSDSLTCSISLSIVNRSLLTSSGRVMFFAALASFQAYFFAQLVTVTSLTSTRCAISFLDMPLRYSTRASSFLFSISFLFIFIECFMVLLATPVIVVQVQS